MGKVAIDTEKDTRRKLKENQRNRTE